MRRRSSVGRLWKGWNVAGFGGEEMEVLRKEMRSVKDEGLEGMLEADGGEHGVRCGKCVPW